MNIPQTGEQTNHQDHRIVPVSFNPKQAKNPTKVKNRIEKISILIVYSLQQLHSIKYSLIPFSHSLITF